MKFIADIMLGKLARYLRMAGNDVIYLNNIKDDQILEIAKKEDRIILTRDRLMLQRKECKNKIIRSLLIKDDKLIAQLQQTKQELLLDLMPNLVRCIECNSLLEEAVKENIKAQIPPYVFKTQNHFLFYTKCRKYFWRGTHYNNINNIFRFIKTLEPD